MKPKNKCSECDSSQTYVRLETQDRVCRSCGAITPLKPKAKPVQDDRSAALDVSQKLIP